MKVQLRYSTKNCNVIFSTISMFIALSVRMAEHAIICLTITTAPVLPGIMVGLAKVRHPLTLYPLLYLSLSIKDGSSAVPLIRYIYLCSIYAVVPSHCLTITVRVSFLDTTILLRLCGRYDKNKVIKTFVFL